MGEMMRLALTKTDAARYVGHLDFCRALERALRRGHFPVAYSEGFNPHMKLSFGPALGVGIASWSEYVDVELTEAVSDEEFSTRLALQLPHGLSLIEARAVSSTVALAAMLNQATYQVRIAVENPQAEQDRAQATLADFWSMDSISFVRRTPKGEKTLEIKQYLVASPILTIDQGGLMLTFSLSMTATGSVKPQEILTVLQQRCGFPAGDADFCRSDLMAATSTGLKRAFEI
jgi:radical SAM-linked protein